MALVLCTAVLSCTSTAVFFKMAAQDIRISKDQVKIYQGIIWRKRAIFVPKTFVVYLYIKIYKTLFL